MTTIRTLLLAACAAGALSLATVRPARAQMAVYDGASFDQLLEQARNGLQQLTTLKATLNVDQNQLQEVTSFYQSFAHLTNASQVVPMLAGQIAVTPLPLAAQAEAAMRGTGGFTGSLASTLMPTLGQIQLYHPVAPDMAAQQMNTAAQATAGQIAAAQALYAGSTQRITGTQQLEEQLAASADPKQSMDLNARATMELGISQAQANEAASLQIMQQAQQRVEQEQADQAWRQDADGLEAAAKAAAEAAQGGAVQSLTSAAPGS